MSTSRARALAIARALVAIVAVLAPFAPRGDGPGKTFSSSLGAVFTPSAVSAPFASFVAIGTNIAASSPDGITWTNRTIPAGTYTSVIWAGDRFVAVAASRKTAYSLDGINWTAGADLPGSTTWNVPDVAWNGTTIVASGYGTGNFIATSTDGALSWTSRTLGAATGNVVSVSGLLGGKFFAVLTGGGGPNSYSSPTGVTWTQGTNLQTSGAWRGVGNNGTRFAATQSLGFTEYTDTTTWAVAGTSPTGLGGVPQARSVAANGNTFVVVDAATTIIAYSTDAAVTWSSPTVSGVGRNAISFGTGLFVVVATNHCMTSPDGINWTSRSIPNAAWKSVAVKP